MNPVDAGLWTLAAALFAMALWWGRPRPRAWDPRWLYEAIRGARRGVIPRTGGDDTPDPPAWLGHGVSWSGLDPSRPEVHQALERRLRDVTLVWFEPPPLHIPGFETKVLPADALLPGNEASLDPLLPRRATRLVLAARAQAAPLLRRLHALPGLRDHVAAVVLIGPELGEIADWLAVNFTHEAIDTELDRVVPWLVLRVGPEAESQRLLEPAVPETGRRSFEIIDLGAIAEDQIDTEQGLTLGLLLAALRG